MTRRPTIFAVLAVLVLPAWGWAEESQGPPAGTQPPGNQASGDIRARTTGNPILLAELPDYSAADVRFGWWQMWSTGSFAKTGEYQDIYSSPFWDFDQFSSDGTRTVAVTATGNDNETDKANAYFYQGGLSAKVDYDRFIHRLDHDPLNNMADPSSPSTDLIIKQDLGVGENYAVRVQELKASFKAVVNEDLKVRLDFWGMQKDGTRQVNAIAMCYTQTTALPPDHPPVAAFSGSRCHVLSMPQQIDWVTTEIKPVIELRLADSLTLEYSRPMRGFSAADQLTSRYYVSTGDLAYTKNGGYPYDFAVVPDSYTQMDQLKVSGRLNDENRVYAYLMAGDTINEEINEKRYFNDMDIRLTNTAIKNVSLTGYGTVYNDAEKQPVVQNLPDALGNVPALAPTAPATANTVLGLAGNNRPAYDYHKSTAGLNEVWRPWGTGFGLGGLAITAGYEYCDLQRNSLLYSLSSTPSVVAVDELHTITNDFQIGPDVRWSTHFDTYLHYKYQNADQPLIGFSRDNGQYNTLLPTTDNIVEAGFNLMPTEHFILNACLGYEAAANHSPFANFTEHNYPFTINAWYGPTQRFSLSAGYAIYSNFVAQNITLADQNLPTTTGALPSSGVWDYGGQAQVWTLGLKYQATPRVQLSGKFEFVLGHDLIDNSATEVNTTKAGPPQLLTTDLGAYSEVQNRTTRLTLGADWQITPRIVNFYRYELYEFLDQEPGYQSGTLQGILGGVSATF